MRIDPRTGDFFRTVIEARELIKHDKRLPQSWRDASGYFLKIMANAGYGVFIETTPKRVPGRKKVMVFSGETKFSTTSATTEDKGPWYCPLIASLITSAGRLLLAMLELAVRDFGGAHLFADTDSMAIVATKEGGLVPCVGGLDHLPYKREAVKALSWTEVEQIAGHFNKLNPYNRRAVPALLKIEDVNYENGLQREIQGYAVSAKRYTFFILTARVIGIITPSEHGFGHLFVPNSDFNEKQGARDWVIETWRYLLAVVLNRECRQPACFSLPAMMKFSITTPDVFQSASKETTRKKPEWGFR